MERATLLTELDRTRDDFRALVGNATPAELRQPTDGTKWDNEQLLFHMLFGYLLVRNLLPLVRGSPASRRGASRGSPPCSTRRRGPSTSSTTWGPLCGARALGTRA